MMDIAKISSKGQITVPVSVRNSLGLKPGDKVFIVEERGRFYLESADSLAFKHVETAPKETEKFYEYTDGQPSYVAETPARYCTVRESIEAAVKEVHDMREGKTEEPTLDSLFQNIEKWRMEE